MLANVTGVLKAPFKKDKLNQVTFFITSVCNLKCKHCFYWKNLNQTDDLNIDEITKISKNLPKFNFLLLSGGEPFLRHEIVDIIKMFRKNNGISQVSIPTNAFLTKKTVERIEELLNIDPKLRVSINFSIDGMHEIHDDIRGREGTFEKSIESIRRANKLKGKYPNLIVNMNTTITHRNFDTIINLINFVKEQGYNFVDGHYFEIIRGAPPKMGMKVLEKDVIRDLYEKVILPYQYEIVKQRRGNKVTNPFFASLARANFSFIYRTQFFNFFEKRDWVMPCRAGQNSIVIDHRGHLAACELRKPITNLREEKYDVIKVMMEEKMKKELASIKKDKCFCTHVCFLTESMYKSPKVVYSELPIHWIRNLFRPNLGN